MLCEFHPLDKVKKGFHVEAEVGLRRPLCHLTSKPKGILCLQKTESRKYFSLTTLLPWKARPRPCDLQEGRGLTIAGDNDCVAGRRPGRRQTGDNAGNELVTERVELVGNDVTARRVKVTALLLL